MRTIAVLSLVSSLLVPTAVGAWQDRIDGVEPNDEFARHVVIDAAGDVISAGTLAGRPSIAPSGGDLVVVKHAGATGSELWRTLVVGAEHGGEVGGLALATNGDAIVAGAIDRTLLTRADFAVTRHAAATGAELWRATYGGPDPYSNDFAEAVAVDAAGDVVAAGAIQTASRTDMLVVKLDGTDGSELWRRDLTGPGDQEDVAHAVAVEPGGGVVVAGEMRSAAGNADFTVVRFAPDGTELWRKLLDGSGHADDAARAVIVGPGGEIFVAGDLFGSLTAYDIVVVRLDPATGNVLWQRAFDSFNSNDFTTGLALDGSDPVVLGIGNDVVAARLDAATGGVVWETPLGPFFARGIAVAPGGDVVIAGSFSGAMTADTVRLAGATGAELWRGGADAGFMLDVAVDATGAPVTVGALPDVQTVNDYAVVKLAGASGAETWRTTIATTGSGQTDEARAVAMDALGDVYAAGRLAVLGDGNDFTVTSFVGATGSERWRVTFHGTGTGDGVAEAVLATPDGAVVAAGLVDNLGTGSDATVVSLDAADGSVRWRTEIDAGAYEVLAAVALDPSGDVVAVGTGGSIATGADIFVLKLDGATGDEKWHVNVEGGRNDGDNGLTVAVDPAGDVIAGGWFAGPSSTTEFAVVKLDGTNGDERWRHVVANDGAGFSAASRVLVGPDGSVYAAGQFQNGMNASDGIVVKLDAATGDEVWRATLDGAAHDYDGASDLARDGAGHLFVTVQLRSGGPLGDFVIAKLDEATGGELWRTSLAGPLQGYPAALAVDEAGDVVATGRFEPGPVGYGIVKVRGTTGAEMWRRLVPFPGIDAFGRAVAVDPLGNAAVVGFTIGGPTWDFVVAKVAGADGTDVLDPCAAGSWPLTGARLELRGLVSRASRSRIRLRGIASPAVPLAAPLDPPAHPLRVDVGGAAGRITTLTVPAGLHDVASGAGWRRRHDGAWIYRGALGASGITRVVLDGDGTAGGIRVTVLARPVDLDVTPADLPLVATLVFDSDVAGLQCAATGFAAGACAFGPGSDRVRCR